jgi:hypothetical protein
MSNKSSQKKQQRLGVTAPARPPQKAAPQQNNAPQTEAEAARRYVNSKIGALEAAKLAASEGDLQGVAASLVAGQAELPYPPIVAAAAKRGQVAIIQWLCGGQLGADPAANDSEALMEAVRHNHATAAQMLYGFGARVSDLPAELQDRALEMLREPMEKTMAALLSHHDKAIERADAIALQACRETLRRAIAGDPLTRNREGLAVQCHIGDSLIPNSLFLCLLDQSWIARHPLNADTYEVTELGRQEARAEHPARAGGQSAIGQPPAKPKPNPNGAGAPPVANPAGSPPPAGAQPGDGASAAPGTATPQG